MANFTINLYTSQVQLMRRYKTEHSPAKLSTETWSASQKTTTKSASRPPHQNGYGGDDLISPAHNTSTQFSVDSQSPRGRGPSLSSENTSMLVKVSQVSE